jgi:hypothetical protein
MKSLIFLVFCLIASKPGFAASNTLYQGHGMSFGYCSDASVLASAKAEAMDSGYAKCVQSEGSCSFVMNPEEQRTSSDGRAVCYVLVESMGK